MNYQEFRTQESYTNVYSNDSLDESSQGYIIPKKYADDIVRGGTALIKGGIKTGAKLAHGATKHAVKKFVQHGEQQPEGSKRRKAAEIIRKAREATLSPEQKRKREEAARKEQLRKTREERAAARESRAAAREARAAEAHERRMGRTPQAESYTHSKTYQQFREDVDQRRQLALQKTKELQAAQKQRVSEYQQAQKEKLAQQRADKQEREAEAKRIEKMKDELRQELQTEQSPGMDPNEYSKQVAGQSARWKGMQIRQSHGERQHQAAAELAAKRARIKALMSK